MDSKINRCDYPALDFIMWDDFQLTVDRRRAWQLYEERGDWIDINLVDDREVVLIQDLVAEFGPMLTRHADQLATKLLGGVEWVDLDISLHGFLVITEWLETHVGKRAIDWRIMPVPDVAWWARVWFKDPRRCLLFRLYWSRSVRRTSGDAQDDE